MDQHKRRFDSKVAALLLLTLLLFALQLRQVLIRPLNDTDFRYVWLAGDMWRAHANPYGPSYIARSVGAFGECHQLLVWVYPFQWYWLAVPLATMTPLAALHVWQASSYLLLAIAACLAMRTSRLLGIRRDRVTMLVMASYTLTFNPLAGTLQLGQPVMLAIFGFAVLVYGLAAGHEMVKLIAIVLLASKPQFGIPILLMLCTSPRGLTLCVMGGAITAILAVPPLLIGGVEEQVGGLLANVTGGYDDVPINHPISMVGMPHVLALAANVHLPISVGLLIAAAATTTVGVVINRHPTLTPADRATYMAALSASAVSCLVGVHPTDLAIVLVTLPLLLRQHRPFLLVGVAGYLLLWRFENLARLVEAGEGHANVSIATAGVLLIGASWVLDLARRLKTQRPAG